MRTQLTSIVAALACLLFVSAAEAQDFLHPHPDEIPNGIYVKAIGGWTDIIHIKKDDPLPDDIDVNVSFDNGYTLGTALGYQMNARLRSELEITWRNASSAKVEPESEFGDTLRDGDVNSFSIMLNGYLNSRPIGQFTPYVGLGFGISIDEVDFPAVSSGSGNVTDLRFDGANFAGQAMAGLRMQLSPRVQLFTEYRYFSTDSFQLHGENADFNTHLRSHNLLGGITLAF